MLPDYPGYPFAKGDMREERLKELTTQLQERWVRFGYDMEPIQAERLARRQIKKNARSCIDARADALRQGASSWPEVLVAYELRKMGLDVHWQAPVPPAQLAYY